MRYLHQRYSMPYDKVRGILTDVGTEELAHLEMIAAILYQLTRDLSPEDMKKAGMDPYFVDHTTGIYPIAASGVPTDMKYIAVKGDVLADLNEDLAADAAITQMQPLSKNSKKTCKIRLFHTLAKRSKFATLLSYKSNNKHF
ncbi:MAG: manganese catalase family protein [Clostridia bacterium]|nr:manganese catalase family protein [Clostridia bacterium]